MFVGGRVRFCCGTPVVRALICIFAIAGCRPAEQPSHAPMDPAGAAWLQKAQRSYLQANYTQALRFIDSAAVVVPDAPDVWYLRGVVLSSLYRFDESNEALERAMEIDPAYRSIRFNMGNNLFLQSSMFARNEYRSALRYYREEERLLRRAIEQGEERPADRRGLSAVLVQIGTTYARLNEADSASKAYQEAADIDSTNADAFAYLATLEQAAGAYETAVEHARTAVRLAPNNDEHALLLGVLLNETERYDEALPLLERAADALPWDQSAAYNLGRVLMELDREPEGTAYLTRADSLERLRAAIERRHMQLFKNPNDPIRWENYAYLLHQAGRTDEARRAVNAMRSISDTVLSAAGNE